MKIESIWKHTIQFVWWIVNNEIKLCYKQKKKIYNKQIKNNQRIMIKRKMEKEKWILSKKTKYKKWTKTKYEQKRKRKQW